MTYTQLVAPNLSAVGRIGWCLEYASRLVFQNPAAGTTAWNAWLVCNKHEDQNFPSGVSFPVWFSGAGGAGHVAVFTPQGIYSSPYNTSTGHAVLSSIAQVEEYYKVKFVGWSEDILNLQVVKENNMQPITPQELDDMCGALWGVKANAGHHANWDGKPFYEAYNATYNDPRTFEYADKVYKALHAAPSGVKPYDGPALFTKI